MKLTIKNHHIFWHSLAILAMVTLAIFSIEAFYILQVIGSILVIASILDDEVNPHWKVYFIGSWVLMGIGMVILGLTTIGDKGGETLKKFNKYLNKE
jgi:hypothetical protein